MYLTPGLFDNEFQFVLPFGIGANGFARISDGSRFVENREKFDAEQAQRHMNTFADLYGPGYLPFEDAPGRGPRLSPLLENWRERVESGDWQVDENGVKGNMDLWREADTENGWEKYVLPVT